VLNRPADNQPEASTQPAAGRDWAELWRTSERVSARQLGDAADLPRLYAQRDRFRQQAIPRLIANHDRSVLFRLDLGRLAASCASLPALPDPATTATTCLTRAQAHAFQAEWLRQRHAAPELVEARLDLAYQAVRETVLEARGEVVSEPLRNLLPDQIVWARSPVRLDLAGGWTDTPPFCFMAGAKVTNLAVDLNGQPPIQVFVRPIPQPVLHLRSIDLGSEVRITTRAELATCTDVHDPFALGKGALALIGFLPPYGGLAYGSLAEQLADFGGGLDISLLAAVPKGSGLGTSSILGAALLGALADACGLGWSQADLVGHTLALEQLLTTGGGWQDQAGGIFPGAKFLTTAADPDQRPLVRWLPERVFAEHSQSILLYYTGITRVAKGILGHVVHHVLLNSGPHLRVIGEIGQAAEAAAEAIQRGDFGQLGRVVDWSRELSRQLDPDSYPAAVQSILQPLQDWLIGAKLLGAGGGGYVLLFAKGPDAAQRLRNYLDRHPPCPGARFVNLSLSPTGLQITRS